MLTGYVCICVSVEDVAKRSTSLWRQILVVRESESSESSVAQERLSRSFEFSGILESYPVQYISCIRFYLENKPLRSCGLELEDNGTTGELFKPPNQIVDLGFLLALVEVTAAEFMIRLTIGQHIPRA